MSLKMAPFDRSYKVPIGVYHINYGPILCRFGAKTDIGHSRFFHTPSAFGVPVKGTQLEFHHAVSYGKTTIATFNHTPHDSIARFLPRDAVRCLRDKKRRVAHLMKALRYTSIFCVITVFKRSKVNVVKRPYNIMLRQEIK